MVEAKKYWKYDDKDTMYNTERAIEKLIVHIKNLISQSTGNEWDIAKIHEMLHVVLNIFFFGAHENVHTVPQEHNYIEHTKKPSKQVQKKKTLLDWQHGNRLSEKYICNVAF